MATESRHKQRPLRPLISLAILVLAMFGIMALSNSWTPKLGLDLRGGTTITLTARNTTGTGAIDPASLEQARTIIQQRVDSVGVGESEVATVGGNQITVSVPNVAPAQLQEMVGQTAQLYFRTVHSVAAATSLPSGLPKPPPEARPTEPAQTPLTTDQALAWQPSARDLADFEAYSCGDPFPDVPDQPLIACTREGDAKLLLGPALINGDMLTGASSGIRQGGVNWVVTLSLNDEGGRIFEQATGAIATRTEPQNTFAIVLDSAVASYASVSAAIPGGQAEISGNFTQETASDLAGVLKYGSLPLTFDLSEVANVSPTLGGEQLRAGIIAGLIGIGLVILYSVIYYRALAVVVVASLAIAATLTYQVMVLLGEAMGFALNLPGIAGAIVAIGMTADSFIIFFERIRDEVREGRPLRSAIETGWIGSRKTILIADAVSLLSAIVLFILAIGSVRGFAFTLGLTTLIDIAIVFWFTKPMVTLLGRTKFFGEGRRFSGFEADHLGAQRRSPIRRLRAGAPKEA